MAKLKKILIAIGTIIISFLTGLISSIFFNEKNTKNSQEKAEKIKEEVRNELKKKSAADIANNSPHYDTISTNIKNEQQELRERLRNRLNQDIHGNGSSSIN